MQQSPLQPTPVGALRFNTDSSKLEYYDGNQWVNITSDSPEAQTGGTRGLFAGGRSSAPAFTNLIEYINVDTTGNAVDFGDLTRQYGQVLLLLPEQEEYFLLVNNHHLLMALR